MKTGEKTTNPREQKENGPKQSWNGTNSRTELKIDAIRRNSNLTKELSTNSVLFKDFLFQQLTSCHDISSQKQQIPQNTLKTHV